MDTEMSPQMQSFVDEHSFGDPDLIEFDDVSKAAAEAVDYTVFITISERVSCQAQFCDATLYVERLFAAEDVIDDATLIDEYAITEYTQVDVDMIEVADPVTGEQKRVTNRGVRYSTSGPAQCVNK